MSKDEEKLKDVSQNTTLSGKYPDEFMSTTKIGAKVGQRWAQ
jgi:hypothetical protein